jgi:hypothetical protein
MIDTFIQHLLSILVPEETTPQVEAVHLGVEHLLMAQTKLALAGQPFV